jgi:hypothetical protein
MNGGSRDAFRTWCEMQFRLGDYQLLLDQFSSIWSSGRINVAKDAGLISLVYQAALLNDHPLAEVLRSALDGIAPSVAIADAIERRRLVAALTTMGRMSYLDAAASLDATVSNNALWRDCSLIALGFFRVLEIELNDKLVRPVASALDFESMRIALQLLPDKRGRGWADRIDRLEGSVSNKHQGLMFGQLKDLFQIAHGPGLPNEAVLRTPIQQAFGLALTAEGRVALADGRLQAIVDSDHVQRFRNPPAHGSFLKLKDAQACEALVRSAIAELHRWLAAFVQA